MAGSTYPGLSDSTFVMPWIHLALPSPQNGKVDLSEEQVNMSRAHYFKTQFFVTLSENENEDFWEWKGKVWSDQAYWMIKDFTFGKFLFKLNRFHLCFVNFFDVCFSKQKILSTCLWKVSRCLEKRGKVLAFNSCVSVSLVLLTEGFLESTQSFGFDFNYHFFCGKTQHCMATWKVERSYFSLNTCNNCTMFEGCSQHFCTILV